MSVENRVVKSGLQFFKDKDLFTPRRGGMSIENRVVKSGHSSGVLCE